VLPPPVTPVCAPVLVAPARSFVLPTAAGARLTGTVSLLLGGSR
jgi:hypothetical protein